jgi:hypothetical protein
MFWARARSATACPTFVGGEATFDPAAVKSFSLVEAEQIVRPLIVVDQLNINVFVGKEHCQTGAFSAAAQFFADPLVDLQAIGFAIFQSHDGFRLKDYFTLLPALRRIFSPA